MAPIRRKAFTEIELIEVISGKFPYAEDLTSLKEAISRNDHFPKGRSEATERETALIMQSAQGIYFGAFAKWLHARIATNDLSEKLNAADRAAGANKDRVVNDYIGMKSANKTMAELGLTSPLLNAKDKALEILIASHACFQRGITDGTLLLTPGEQLADTLISSDFDGPYSRGLSKSYKKLKHWLLNFDEAYNIFISTFVTALSRHQREIGRHLNRDEFDLLSDRLLRFLNGAAHLPRQKGMSLVHQVDYCGEGVTLAYKGGVLVDARFSSSMQEHSQQTLDNDALTKRFFDAAKKNVMSTGCPAVHLSTNQTGSSANLLQLCLTVFRDELRSTLFDTKPVRRDVCPHRREDRDLS